MDFGGRYRLEASRLQVWGALNDTAVLKAAIPGCSRIQWVSDHALEAAITVNLGIVKPTFTGDLVLSDVEPAVSYTLSGRGHGGLLGLAHGAADITLEDDGEATILAFAATGGASGRIMKLGRRIVGAGAQGVIDGFFERFAHAMGVGIVILHETDTGPSGT